MSKEPIDIIEKYLYDNNLSYSITKARYNAMELIDLLESMYEIKKK